jgi:two-component system NarL family response regulator
MLREALRSWIAAEQDMEVVAEAGTGVEILQAVALHHPDVLVLDIGLPDMTGIQVAALVREQHPDVLIVALSGHADRIFVEEILKAGARGYVVKSAGAEELIRAIRAARDGHVFLSPELTASMLRHVYPASKPAAPPLSVLGPREREVLSLLATGLRSNEIAAEMKIAPATVDVHRRNIKHKLGLHTTAELTRYAIREGLHSL